MRDGGAEIVLASTNGGFPWPDLAREDEDASTPETQRFRQDRAARDDAPPAPPRGTRCTPVPDISPVVAFISARGVSADPPPRRTALADLPNCSHLLQDAGDCSIDAKGPEWAFVARTLVRRLRLFRVNLGEQSPLSGGGV